MQRTIGFIGSLALLVSGLTGPSLAVIPLLFQQAGWLTFVFQSLLFIRNDDGALFLAP